MIQRGIFGVASAGWFCSVLLLSAASLPGPSFAADSEPLKLRYALYAGGLRAIDFNVQLERDAEIYEIEFDAQSSGFLARLVTFSM